MGTLLKFLHALSVAEWKASDPQVGALADTAGSLCASVPTYTYSTNRVITQGDNCLSGGGGLHIALLI